MPDLDVFTRYYVDAFFVLSNSRNIGMGLGAIPVSEILMYCAYLEDDDPEAFVDIIQKVDSFYLELNREKSDD